MVDFLAESGVDISLLTFQGFQFGDSLLLARQVERSAEVCDIGTGPRRSAAERRRALSERATDLNIEDLWENAVKALALTAYSHATGVGITFYQPKITLPDDVNVSGSHSVAIDQRGMIRVTFYPGAVHLCLEKFKEMKETIPFEFEKPPNAPTTKLVSEQWFCLLDKKKWEMHREGLINLAKDVQNTWREIRNGQSAA